jgi:hypothetical protein
MIKSDRSGKLRRERKREEEELTTIYPNSGMLKELDDEERE